MRTDAPKQYLALLFVLLGVFCSCDKQGNAQERLTVEPFAQQAEKPASVEKAKSKADGTKYERISVSEIGKLRSRVGKEVIVFGKVAGTSTSGSGHHFLNFPNGFKIVCLKDKVAKFGKGGPAKLFEGKLIEVQGELASHQGKPQISVESPGQIRVIELGKTAASDGGKKFEMLEVAPNTWVSPAGLRYVGRDAQGKTRKAHVLRHAQDQPDRAGSHGVFDADGDEVFKVIDEAWDKIEKNGLGARTEGDSQTYTVSMGRRIGYLGGKNGARRNKPALKSVFLVVRKGTKEVITAFPK